MKREPLASDSNLLTTKLRVLNASVILDPGSGLYEAKTSSCDETLAKKNIVSGQFLNCFINCLNMFAFSIYSLSI